MKPVQVVGITFGVIAAFAVVCLGQVPGGFRMASVTDKEVIAAAKFAVEDQSKKEQVALVKILKAQTQVVAGRNFRITMDVRVDGGIRQADADVWVKLDRTYELTKWEWKGKARPEEKRKP